MSGLFSKPFWVNNKSLMDWKRILIGRWSWKRPFISIASIYLMLVLVALFMADRLIFLPPPASYGSTFPGLTHVTTLNGERIAMMHLPAAPGMPTLLYSHGNAEDLAQSANLYEAWNTKGLGAVAYDYPGYGHSTGSPGEKSVERSIEAVWNHLTASGIPASSIIIVGRSVGSGPAVWLASRHPEAGGLVLIAPFTSTFAVAIPTPFPVLPGDRFPNLRRIRSIDLPLLVIHGENDEVIPAAHGRKLVRASPAKNKTYHLVPGAGHNDLFAVTGDELIELVADFATTVGP